MLMFSNGSLMLSALKCRSMAVASTPHSILVLDNRERRQR